jgi:hypothetical protein
MLAALICFLTNDCSQFYLVEVHPIMYARQILLLRLATMPLDQIGLHTKVVTFMEVFGNVMIRPQTMKLVQTCCESLIKYGMLHVHFHTHD